MDFNIFAVLDQLDPAFLAPGGNILGEVARFLAQEDRPQHKLASLRASEKALTSYIDSSLGSRGVSFENAIRSIPAFDTELSQLAIKVARIKRALQEEPPTLDVP